MAYGFELKGDDNGGSKNLNLDGPSIKHYYEQYNFRNTTGGSSSKRQIEEKRGNRNISDLALKFGIEVWHDAEPLLGRVHHCCLLLRFSLFALVAAVYGLEGGNVTIRLLQGLP